MSGPNLKMSFSPMTYGHKHGGARDIDSDRRDAKLEKPSKHSGADRGEAVTPMRPSNSSTVANAKAGKSFAEQPQPVPHSSHGERRRKHYTDNIVEASQIRPSTTKMTRAEHPKTNAGDKSIGWPASRNTTLGQR